ncbi:MAG: GNAT family N-acetyltransferase [Bacillota bacterium]
MELKRIQHVTYAETESIYKRLTRLSAYTPKFDEVYNYYKYLLTVLHEGSRYYYIMDGKETIGIGFLKNINRTDKKCQMDVYIFDKENIGKGYGSFAIRKLLSAAFQELRLHSVISFVHSNNERSVKALSNIGFKEIGRLRESILRDNQFHDEILFQIMDYEYNQPSE